MADCLCQRLASLCRKEEIPMKGLTKRQNEIVHYISEYINIHRFSPSYREIMEHFGFTSLGTVYKHVQVLKRKGMIQAEKNAAAP